MIICTLLEPTPQAEGVADLSLHRVRRQESAELLRECQTRRADLVFSPQGQHTRLRVLGGPAGAVVRAAGPVGHARRAVVAVAVGLPLGDGHRNLEAFGSTPLRFPC